MSTRARLEALHRHVCEALVERDEAARVLLLAALSGEHVLLLGPPGTAKSELARRLRHCLAEGAYFERLLTKFSVPEELFGPLSIKSLERDEYLRLVEGYLPTAAIAFLDEIFNANSAILNALLTLLNEREFDNGTRRVQTPLVSVVAATNHVPDGPELGALHDRFLFRYQVRPVSTERFGALLDVVREPAPIDAALRLSPDELADIRRRADAVPLSPSVRGVIEAMRKALADKGHYVSDRRWRKIARVLRVAALCDGRDEVVLADVWLMLHCLWDRAEQIELVEGLLRAALDAALVDEPKRYEAIAAAFEKEIERERASSEQACDDDGRPLYYDETRAKVTEPYRRRQAMDANGQLLFLAPPDMIGVGGRASFTMAELWERHFQNKGNGFARFEAWVDNPTNQAIVKELREPVHRPARWPEEHLAARARQLAELREEVESFRRGVSALRGGEERSSWVPEERCQSIADRLGAAEGALAAITERLHRLAEAVHDWPGRFA